MRRESAGSKHIETYVMPVTNYIVMGLMGVWVLFWVLEIILKLKDGRFSKGCRHDDDDGFSLSFIRIGRPSPDNNGQEEEQDS